MREGISDLKSQISKKLQDCPQFFLRILFGLIVCLVLVAGCYDPPPAYVFIPGPEVSANITISVSTTKAIVDEPVILYAFRRTSGFVEIPYSELPEGVQWWRQMPPGYEKEVAGTLRWVVEPEGSARFNTDLRMDLTREVRFPIPGVYRLRAVSAVYGPTPVSSQTVTIEVEEINGG